MGWIEVVTEPLGLAGFALALVFTIVRAVVARTPEGRGQWIVPAGFALAALCIVGGLIIDYQRVRSEPRSSPHGAVPSATSMQIGTIKQQLDGGAAVAGVQGNVTVNAPTPQENAKPKP